MHIEPLESRIAPAAITVIFDAPTGKLTVTGSTSADDISIFQTEPSSYRVLNGSDLSRPFDFTGKLKTVEIDGGGGTDPIKIANLTLDSFILSGASGFVELEASNLSIRGSLTLDYPGVTAVFDDRLTAGEIVVNYGPDGGSVEVVGTTATVRRSIELTGGAGSDAFEWSPEKGTLRNGGIVFSGGAGEDSLIIGGGQQLIGQGLSRRSINFLDGEQMILEAESLTLKSRLNFTGSAGVDQVRLGGANLKIFRDVRIATLGGLDEVVVDPTIGSVSSAMLIDLGEDGGTLNVQSHSLTLSDSVTLSGLGDETVTIAGDSVILKDRLSINFGSGANLTSVSATHFAVGGALSVTGAGGSNVFETFGQSFSVEKAVSIDFGAGDHVISLRAETQAFGSTLAVTTGAGADVMEISGHTFQTGGDLTATLGEGANSFVATPDRFGVKGSLKISAGAADDQIRLIADGSISGNVEIDAAGALGSVQEVSLASSSGLVGNLMVGGALAIKSTGAGAGVVETLTLTEVTVAKTLSLALGEANSNVAIDNLIAKGLFSLTTGGGNDAVAIERDDNFGPSIFSKAVTIDAGAGDDQVFIGISTVDGPAGNGGTTSKASAYARFLGAFTAHGGTHSVGGDGGGDDRNEFLDPLINFFAAGFVRTEDGFEPLPPAS